MYKYHVFKGYYHVFKEKYHKFKGYYHVFIPKYHIFKVAILFHNETTIISGKNRKIGC